MSRMPRFFVDGVPLHVIARGNNRSPIFLEDADRAFYCGCLGAAARRHAVAIHAYVLMTNHVHMLATAAMPDGMPRAMHAVNLVYAQYFNHKYARTGTIWEGRYKAAIVEDEAYALTCMRYIELNPVRAGMVPGPAHYRWSSYHAGACGAADPLWTPHPVYLRLGTCDTERRSAYRALVGARLPQEDIDLLRDATQHGWAVGTPGFCARVGELSRRPERRLRGRKSPTVI